MATQNDTSTNDADLAMRKLYQAEALTQLIYGDGFENFSNHREETQENVLWLLAELVGDARVALHRSLTNKSAKAKGGAA